MKDNFSKQSDKYARFRPLYPDDMYAFIYSLVPAKTRAWDCATGNGQIASVLAESFTEVYATDISASQLSYAPKKSNIHYSEQQAEKVNFPDRFFNLITVGQAIHWFEFERFYTEVKRTALPGGILAVIGYGLAETDDDINLIIKKFYSDIVGKYWDKERVYIDEQYRTIPFPFDEIAAPEFQIQTEWTLQELKGFFATWSAVQHFIDQEGFDPVELIDDELEQLWRSRSSLSVKFPILLRTGKC